ncbi:MAG: glycosyltransferase, partial [Bacteroidota bacterium]
AADRVDHFITNSEYIEKRIQKYYHRNSTVIHPGIDIEKLKIPREEKKYYLAVGRITTYKKFNIIVDAFNELEIPLKIVGTGVEEKKLKKRAHENIEFLGRVSDQELSKLYTGAKALIFPQCEDFGITPIESMAHGTPVIAYREGGVLETVKEGVSGIFFEKQEKDDLLEAIKRFEKQEKNFSPEKIYAHAGKFSNEIFKKNILKFLEAL